MKQILFCVFALSVTLNAETLQEILDTQKTDNKTKSIEAKRDALIAQNGLITTYEVPSLVGTLSHAQDPLKEGLEYSVALTQNIENPFDINAKESVSTNLSNATKQETRHELHLIELDITSKYYATCISKELKLEAESLFMQQQKRVTRLQKAYELGEISKKELLFNRLDLAKLKKSATTYKRVYLEDFSHLQKSVGDLELTSVACSDLVEPKRTLQLKNINEHGELRTLKYKKNAANTMYKLYDSPLQALSYEFRFEQELETKRYTVGLSIPLGILSSRQERLKKQELQTATSYAFAKDSLYNEIKNTTAKLKDKLELIYDEYKSLETEIVPLNKELLKLSKSAYKEGEGTIMEYLDVSRSYTQNMLDMLETKKTYYYELFELYKSADMEYGEEK